MATPSSASGPRGPERHTHTSTHAVDRPSVSPAETWPVSPAVVADSPAEPVRVKVRVKKKRKRSAKRAALRLAKKALYYLAVLAALTGLCFVAFKIFG